MSKVHIVAVAIVTRVLVACVWLRTMPMVSDAADYADFARDLVRSFPGANAYYWPPGNSLVLAGAFAVFGNGVWVARIVALALSVLAVPLVMRFAREIDPASERASGWLAALYMPAVLLSGQSYAQHLAALCLLAVAYFGMRAMRDGTWSMFLYAGISLGLGCLTRPSMASVVIVLAVAWIASARKQRAPFAKLAAGGAILVASSAAIVTPVVMHNVACGAGATISTNNERNLFLGNNPYTPSYKTSHLGQRSLDDLDPDARAYLSSFKTRESMQHEAISYVAHHPLETAYRTFNRATSFWGFDYLASRIIQEDREWGKRGLMPLLTIEAGSYAVTMILAIVALFAMSAGDAYGRRWLVWIALAYELPYMLAFSGGTYHFPAAFVLLPLAGIAASRAKEAWAALKKSRAAIIALIAFAAIQIEYAYYSILMSG